jgi:hypothetical protein
MLIFVLSIHASIFYFPLELCFPFHSYKKKRPLWEDASYSPQLMINRLYNMRSCGRNFSCADYTIIDHQGKNMETKIDALIAKMERSRARLNAVLDKVTPQVEIYPSWKLKQVLDHITGWDELVSNSLRSYSHGETPAFGVMDGIDQYNATSVSARKAIPMDQSRLAYDTARENVIQALREMPPEMLAQQFKAPWGGMCTVASVVKIFVSHEQEHAKQIEETLLKSTGSL